MRWRNVQTWPVMRRIYVAILLVLLSGTLAWAAGLKITERPFADPLDGTEIIGIIQNGQDKQITSADIGAIGGSAQGLGPNFDLSGGNVIAGATEAKPVSIRGSGAHVTTGFDFLTHSNGTPMIDCVIAGVVGACDWYRPLSAGKYSGLKDRNGAILIRELESTDGWQSEVKERSTDGATPATGYWSLYFKSTGLFIKDDAGVVSGPLGSGGGGTIVRKTSNEIVNNSATRQADNELLFAVDASSNYIFEAYIVYSSATAADFSNDFTLPASATGRYEQIYIGISAANCASPPTEMYSAAIGTGNNNIGGAGVGTICSFQVKGFVVTAGTAGTVTYTWAQSTANASDATVYTNSYIKWQKL